MSRQTLAETTPETTAPGFKFGVDVDIAPIQGEGKVLFYNFSQNDLIVVNLLLDYLLVSRIYMTT
jgi:hypothetical protein